MGFRVESRHPRGTDTSAEGGFLWRNLGTLAADSWLLVRAWFSRGFWLSRSVLLKGVELLTFRSFRFVSSLLGFRASFGLVDPVFQRVFRDDRS